MSHWKLVLAGVLSMAASGAYAAGKITTYTSASSFGGDAVVDWGGLGTTYGAGAILGTAFNNLPSGVAGVTVSGSSTSLLSRVDQGFNYLGNFAPGDRLLTTTAVRARNLPPAIGGKGPGPIRFMFTGPISGAGLQISTSVPGPFTATLKAFDPGGVLLGALSASGASTSPPAGDNSAPFLGIRSSSQEIESVEVDVPGLTGVTVNRMQVALNALPIADNTSDTTFFVSQLYRDIWNVSPDPAGTASWVAQLSVGTATRPQVAEAFFNNPQFQVNAMYIAKLYIALKLRDPDFAGWFALFGQMQNGTTQAAVLDSFMTAPEVTSLYDGLADPDFVTALYQNVLGRGPQAAELSDGLAKLTSGAPRADVVNALVTGAELDAKVRFRVLVDLLYFTLLRRAPEPADLNAWTAVLGFGLPLRCAIGAFIANTEYLARFSAN